MHKFRKLMMVSALGAAWFFAGTAAEAQDVETFEAYLGAEAPSFDTAESAVDALKQKLSANDLSGTAMLLGLDPERVAKFEGAAENFETIRSRAADKFNASVDGDQRIIELGDEIWPFPFPVRKTEAGKWAFDTEAGLQEIINRRVGENELQAISTARSYVDAQNNYAGEDRDGDGVLEYAQRLVSSEGQTDGLYWSAEQGDGDSPAGALIDQGELDKARAGEGYFGYKFKILRGQGDNVAGDRYDYTINGNMIAGFGLIAWPAKYGITGVNTFVVDQSGIVYEKDFGPDTQMVGEKTFRFNPDKSWSIVND